MVEHHSAGFPTLFAMWSGMTAVMMTPVVWPWLKALRRVMPEGASVWTVPAFAVGYGAAWVLFSTVMAASQLVLARAGAAVPLSAAFPSVAGAGLVAAGAFQFSALKNACLDHCRSPMGFFLSRWRGGGVGALRMGGRHGIFCLGCCWALMALALFVGAMDWRLMAVMTGVMLVETATPLGVALSRPLGGFLVVCGLGLLLLG